MTEPTLLLASAGAIGEFGTTFGDFGVDYTMRVRTVQAAPAGIGGAALFPGYYLLVTFNVAFELRATPILDGNPLWDESVDIAISTAPADGRPQTHVFEIVVDLPRKRGGAEVGRYFAMGRWFQVEVWQPCPPGDAGIVEVELVELEYEVVSESQGAT